MSPNQFEQKSAGLTDHNDFAEYINKVKEDAQGTEYQGAVLHELNRATQLAFDRLMETADQTQILLLVGALRGLRMASEHVTSKWPIDKEIEE